MSSTKQVLANQANAQFSTGPRTAEGKASSARNSFSHGLSATPESLFAHSPALAEEFRAYEATLREDYGPQVATIEPLFDRWVFAAFQLKRAQAYEARAEADMANDFGNLELEKRWMRFIQVRLRLAREAAAAAKDYHAIRAVFSRCEAIQESNKHLSQADQEFHRAFDPDPLQEQTNPNRMDELFNRFQSVLANMAPPQRK